MSGDDLGRPLILTVAPNGARKTQADHPALPMTAAENARTEAACAVTAAALGGHARVGFENNLFLPAGIQAADNAALVAAAARGIAAIGRPLAAAAAARVLMAGRQT